MNENFKSILEKYFANIDDAMQNDKITKDYKNTICYQGCLAKMSQLLEQKLSGNYVINAVYKSRQGKQVNIKPHIFIKAKTNEETIDKRVMGSDGIYIYLELFTNSKNPEVYISLELGKKARYLDAEETRNINIVKIRNKFDKEIKEAKDKLNNLGSCIVDSDGAIFAIEIFNLNKVWDYFEIFLELYQKQIEQIIKYNLENKVWNKNWEKFQQDVFNETYLLNSEFIKIKVEEITNDINIPEINEPLVIKPGKLNIKKYNSNKKAIKHQKKIDHIAEEIANTKQGEINEKTIFEAEIQRLNAENALSQVQEMEEFFQNKVDDEGYDILSFEKDKDGNYIKKYIEVKSTQKGEETPIDITKNELEFAQKNVENYYLYRIVNSNSKDRYVKKVKGEELLKDFNFIPTKYKIYSK